MFAKETEHSFPLSRCECSRADARPAEHEDVGEADRGARAAAGPEAYAQRAPAGGGGWVPDGPGGGGG